MTEPADSPSSAETDNETDLAAEVADWTPPWQRQRADTPADEPVAYAEPVSDGVAAPQELPEPAPHPRPDPESETVLPLAENLHATLEAILMVCDEPVSEGELAQALGRNETEVTDALHRLAAEYTGDERGFDLRRQAGGWRYYTRESYAPYVERFVLDGQQVKLTKAALETLAVIAYRQPVTRGRVSAIRGVNCDGVIRTLTTRGLITECGTDPEAGANLYATTSLFLDKLGLNSVDELPALAPFLPDNLDEIGDTHDG